MIQVLFAICYLQESPASFIKRSVPLHLSIIMSSFYWASCAVSFPSVFDFRKYATLDSTRLVYDRTKSQNVLFAICHLHDLPAASFINRPVQVPTYGQK